MKGSGPVLTIPEAVEYSKLSRRSIERLIERDDIRTVRYVGIRRVFIPLSELDRIITEGSSDVPASVPGARHNVAAFGGSRRKP